MTSGWRNVALRSEEHTSELQSPCNLVCRLLLEKKMKNIPTGTMVHNIDMRPGKGGQLVRSAGGSAQLLSNEGDYAQLRLPSGQVRKIHIDCMASVGQVGNPDHENITLGKAGRKRWMGIRPTVRGVAMNPVDHPLGGGEGKRSGGRHPATPWGQPTPGYKNRKNKETDRFIWKRRGTNGEWMA